MTVKILEGVRGGDDGFPVSICHDDATGRLMLRAINEGGYACTDVDLADLLAYLANLAPGDVNVDAVLDAVAAGDDSG